MKYDIEDRSVKNIDIMKEVLTNAAAAFESAAIRISQEQADALSSLFGELIKTEGSLIFCGVGKSGLVGEKCAATFTSLGLPSFMLHPTEALHGDLGIIRKNDAIVLISYSGTSEEILKLIPYLPVNKSKRIALVGNVNSPIGLECSVRLDCSVEKEACLNNQAPTTSSSLTMALGDSMAVLFESLTGLSKEGFAQNHPGGKLGKSLRLKVGHIMVRKEECPILNEDQSLKDAIVAMTAKPVGGAIFLDDEGAIAGLFVEGDIRRLLSQENHDLKTKLKSVINKNPVSIESSALAIDGLKLMEDRDRPFSILPVVEDDKFVGILRLHDLFKEGL